MCVFNLAYRIACGIPYGIAYGIAYGIPYGSIAPEGFTLGIHPSPGVSSLVLFCSMTLMILAPCGNSVPPMVVGLRGLPIRAAQWDATSWFVSVTNSGGCLSGMASGRVCRPDCFPTVARSAAAPLLCLDLCFLLAGGSSVANFHRLFPT